MQRLLNENQVKEIRSRYQLSKQLKSTWDNITNPKLAEKFETSIDTIRGINNGTHPRDKNITEHDIKLITELIEDRNQIIADYKKHSPMQLSKEFNLCRTNIRQIGERKVYKDVEDEC